MDESLRTVMSTTPVTQEEQHHDVCPVCLEPPIFPVKVFTCPHVMCLSCFVGRPRESTIHEACPQCRSTERVKHIVIDKSFQKLIRGAMGVDEYTERLTNETDKFITVADRVLEREQETHDMLSHQNEEHMQKMRETLIKKIDAIDDAYLLEGGYETAQEWFKFAGLMCGLLCSMAFGYFSFAAFVVFLGFLASIAALFLTAVLMRKHCITAAHRKSKLEDTLGNFLTDYHANNRVRARRVTTIGNIDNGQRFVPFIQ